MTCGHFVADAVTNSECPLRVKSRHDALKRVRATAHALDLEAARLEIWRSEEIAPAFEAIRGKADASPLVEASS